MPIFIVDSFMKMSEVISYSQPVMSQKQNYINSSKAFYLQMYSLDLFKLASLSQLSCPAILGLHPAPPKLNQQFFTA